MTVPNEVVRVDSTIRNQAEFPIITITGVSGALIATSSDMEINAEHGHLSKRDNDLPA